jgi:hypothetical protein
MCSILTLLALAYVVYVLRPAAGTPAGSAAREAFVTGDPRSAVSLWKLQNTLTSLSRPEKYLKMDAPSRVVSFHEGATPLRLEHKLTSVIMDLAHLRPVRGGRSFWVWLRSPYEMLIRGATTFPGMVLQPAHVRVQVKPTTVMRATGSAAQHVTNYLRAKTRVVAHGLTSQVAFRELEHHHASAGEPKTSEVAKFANLCGLTIFGSGSPAAPFKAFCVLKRAGAAPTVVGIEVRGDASIAVWCHRIRGRERHSLERAHSDGVKRAQGWLGKHGRSNGRVNQHAVLRGAPVGSGGYTVAAELTRGKVRVFVENAGGAKEAYVFRMPKMLAHLKDYYTDSRDPAQLLWEGSPDTVVMTAPLGDLTGGLDGPAPFT